MKRTLECIENMQMSIFMNFTNRATYYFYTDVRFIELSLKTLHCSTCTVISNLVIPA